MTDLFRWLRALRWPDELGTIPFLEQALDFEEFFERTLPTAPRQCFGATHYHYKSTHTCCGLHSHTYKNRSKRVHYTLQLT